MERYTTQNNDRKNYWREFESYGELIDVARNRLAKGQDNYGNSSITGGYDFTGTRNLSEAIELAEQGWADGTDRIREVAESIEVPQDNMDNSHRIVVSHNIAGEEPDIGRFLQGQPEHMIEFHDAQLNVGKVINLFVVVSQMGEVEKNCIVNRGATILAAIESLQLRGYSLGLYVVAQSECANYSSDVFTHSLPLVEAGQITNIDTIGFAIMHPSFFRRFIFAAREAEPLKLRDKLGAYEDGGYGVSVDKILCSDKMAKGYVVEKDFGLTGNKKAMTNNAQKIVDDCIKTLMIQD